MSSVCFWRYDFLTIDISEIKGNYKHTFSRNFAQLFLENCAFNNKLNVGYVGLSQIETILDKILAESLSTLMYLVYQFIWKVSFFRFYFPI